MPIDRRSRIHRRPTHVIAALGVVVLTSVGRLNAQALPTQTPDDDAPAPRYAHGSTSALGALTLGAGFLGGTEAGSAFQATVLTGGLALRFVTRPGFTVEPRIGLDAFLATGAGDLYAVFAARAGLGAGWTFALGRSVAISPMLSYEAMYLGGGLSSNLAGVAHLMSVEVPLTVFLGRRAFMEIFVRVGAITLLEELSPLLGGGYRIGVVL